MLLLKTVCLVAVLSGVASAQSALWNGSYVSGDHKRLFALPNGSGSEYTTVYIGDAPGYYVTNYMLNVQSNNTVVNGISAAASATGSIGVYGINNDGIAVKGHSYYNYGVHGLAGATGSTLGAGGWFQHTSSNGIALLTDRGAVSFSNSGGSASTPVLSVSYTGTDYNDHVAVQGTSASQQNDEKLVLQRKAAEASRERIRTNLALADKELNRYTRLRDTNSVADRKYDEALAAYRVLSMDIEKIEVEIKSLDYDIHRKEVVAPFSGFVAREHTQVGEWMVPGGPVVTLADLDRMWIIVDVPERYLPLLPQKGDVSVTVNSASKDRIAGRIDAVLPIGNERARTFPVKIGIENIDHRIKSGMEAIAQVGLENQMEALMVPKDAIVPAGNARMVYRVTDGTVNPIAVEVTGYHEGSAIVSGDLAEGEQVVIRGNERLRPGQPVRIVQ